MTISRRYNLKRNMEISKRHLNGESSTSLSNEFGISPSRVTEITKIYCHKVNTKLAASLQHEHSDLGFEMPPLLSKLRNYKDMF